MKEPLYRANGWNYLSTFLFLEMFAVGVLSPLVLAATWGNRHDMQIGFGIASLCVFPFCAIVAWSHNRFAQKKSGFVLLEDETVHIFERDDEPPCYSAPISECRWFYGGRSWATWPVSEKVFRIQIGPKAIILEFPEDCVIPERQSGKSVTPEQPVIVAVGLTNETRQEWEEILKQRQVTHHREKERSFAPIPPGMEVVWVIVGSIGCFFLGGSIAIRYEMVLNGLNVPPDIVKGIFYSLILPGLVFWIFVLVVFPLIWWGRQAGSRRKLERGSPKYRKVIKDYWISAIIASFLIILRTGVWIGNDLTLRGKIAFTISVLLMVAFVVWGIIRLSSEKPEPVE